MKPFDEITAEDIQLCEHKGYSIFDIVRRAWFCDRCGALTMTEHQANERGLRVAHPLLRK